MARRQHAASAPPWAGDLPVFERVLENGLKALVLPRKHAPVAVCEIAYPVGSYNEPPGRSGLAHFVEHMLFKGTARFPKGHIDRVAFAAGGQTNAETGEDQTHYWFSLPADRWEVALVVEADRMAGALFDPGEIEAERRVIAEERSRDLESPFKRLDQAHLTATYVRHPYRNPVIGWPDDLERITADDLAAFYRTHYRPDGAVLVLAGDLDPDHALDRVAHHFGKLKRGSTAVVAPDVDEPRQMGRRDFELIEAESVARGLMGWHSARAGHADVAALDVLSDILTCGRRSRAWSLLVERDRIATWVDASQQTERRAGQFLIQVEATPGVDHRRIEDELLDTIAALADEGPTSEELMRSRNRLEAAWRWERGEVEGLASGLSDVALWEPWTAWQEEHRAALRVDADDVRRVASAYLVESGLTVGWSLPRPGRIVTVVLPSQAGQTRRAAPAPAGTYLDVAAERPLGLKIPGGATTLPDYAPRREVLANGMRLLSEERPGQGVVALELYVGAGQTRERKPGLAYLTGRLLESGTTRRTGDQLAREIEDVGGSLEVAATGVTLKVRSEDLEQAVDWIADVAIESTFPEDSVRWLKRKIAAEYQSDRDDPSFRAENVFRALVYGDHPLARDPRGAVRDVAKLGRDDVLTHHAANFTPDNTFLAAAGDFDAKALAKLVKRRFGGWAGRGAAPPSLPALFRGSRPKVRRLSRSGEQVHILMGHLGVARTHPDFAALAILDHILGTGPGFTDRLGRILRDELGLAYTAGGEMTDSADVHPGLFRIYVGTGPDQVERAVAAVREQVTAMHRGEFSDREVEAAGRYLAGSWVFDYQTIDQRAQRLMDLERWGLPLDEPTTWPDRLAAVTPRDVRLAAFRHLDPSALALVECGPLRPDAAADAECA